MLESGNLFASFAVRDTETARAFYGETLGLDVRDGQEPGILEINGTAGAPVVVYPKHDHEPAVFTVLNIVVPDIDAAVEDLTESGVTIEHYEGDDIKTDEKGIMRGNGPSIAWFKDPDGNILSVLEDARP
jgi:catechol 2,3-dioxygenase-like lactoylglutathione lyase family enzyme